MQWPPPDFIEEIKPHRVTCLAKTGASEAAILEFSDGKIHDDPVVKCYMNCMFHEYEIVDDDGEFHTEKVIDKIPDSLKAVAIPLLNTCFNVHVDGETQCDRAHLLHKCWKLADPVVDILI